GGRRRARLGGPSHRTRSGSPRSGRHCWRSIADAGQKSREPAADPDYLPRLMFPAFHPRILRLSRRNAARWAGLGAALLLGAGLAAPAGAQEAPALPDTSYLAGEVEHPTLSMS